MLNMALSGATGFSYLPAPASLPTAQVNAPPQAQHWTQRTPELYYKQQSISLPLIRQAIRAEQKIVITYRDDQGVDSVRVIWPFALGFFDRVRLVLAGCELRQHYRHFRTDMDFGRTFMARDPGGHRLRVFTPAAGLASAGETDITIPAFPGP